MQRDYRGHLIRLIEARGWSAELIEHETGAMLPTTVSATESEGVEVCTARAKNLIDFYLAAQEALARGRSGVRLRPALDFAADSSTLGQPASDAAT